MTRHAVILLVCIGEAAFAAGDAQRGAQVFRQCAACHSTVPGEHLTGPSLAQVLGRKAGSVEGFARYSDALKRSAVVWSEATLDRWLANPEKLVPGNSMTFAGIRELQSRQDVMAFLQAAGKGEAPSVAQPAMKGMARPKLDLKNAPASGQVRSIKYCGDTYTVETADGKVEKIWEFNLRFKSDSSRLGPAPGKPVVVGAGMQGDRASIVFASPEEITRTIVRSCS